MSLFGFFFLDELGKCPQNLMLTRGVEPKSSIFRRGYAEITYKGQFLTIKLVYENFLDCRSER
jgi:hypothetical protein